MAKRYRDRDINFGYDGLIPYVCTACRRSFKRPKEPLNDYHQRPCSLCRKPALAMSQLFKVPPQKDKDQWDMVVFLIEKGFRFHGVWDQKTDATVKYPATLKDAKVWAAKWSHLPFSQGGPVKPIE